ncbi:hypothetical protein CKY01_03375 [Photorhabdus laumondii subsp. clarkei]|uniref:Uncharacterized protein n=1 Tax=Photorhabdus laumondii subsp. clarkei TaxID=2029685 RepID=A0A329VL72_9GAMM|nr:hypothetical protein CKY01_03375 [Photorhabdus laumondii subsp. clarkei]
MVNVGDIVKNPAMLPTYHLLSSPKWGKHVKPLFCLALSDFNNINVGAIKIHISWGIKWGRRRDFSSMITWLFNPFII